MRYSTMAPDSAIVLAPSVITGDLPSGWTCFSSGGAIGNGDMRWYFTISYGVPISSSSQRIRCERELFRWWTFSMAPPLPLRVSDGGRGRKNGERTDMARVARSAKGLRPMLLLLLAACARGPVVVEEAPEPCAVGARTAM